MDLPHPFIVVDQNQLRDAEAIGQALDRCCRERLQVLLPDGAGSEMSKGSKPFDTWRRSLSHISPYSEYVSLARKMTEMMHEEDRTGRPVETLVDDRAVDRFRSMLNNQAKGDLSQLQEMINGPVQEEVPASLAVWGDHARNKRRIQHMCEVLRDQVSRELLDRLRRSPMEALTSWVTSDDGTRFVFQGMKHRGSSDEDAICLSRGASVAAHFYLALAALAAWWLAHGGLDDAAPEKITNDISDVEYAVLGALSVDLLSRDKRLNDIYGVVRAAARSRHQWFDLHVPLES